MKPSMPAATAPRSDAGADRARTAIGWGAAIVDEQDRETPITESMIEQACRELDSHWLFPRQAVAAR